MGIFDFFRRKTDDEIELEEVTKRAKAASASQVQVSRMSLEDTKPNVIRLLSNNRKLEAIKFVVDSTGVSLKEAKDFVEKYESVANTAKAHLENPYKNNEVPEAIANQARTLLSQGRKIEAVKLVKDSTNLGLKECKDFVESL